jgi:hypothetical protein
MLPSTAIQRWDLSISYQEFNLRANRKGFVGLRVLPAIGVAKDHANFLRVKIASVLGPIEDTRRNIDGTYKRDDFKWHQDSYATDEHGVEEVLDDATLERYKSEIRAEQIKSERAINRVIQAHENAVAAAVFNTSTWTGADLTTAVSIPWSTKATAVPITNIDAAINKVKTNSGQRPNSLIIPDLALRYMKRTDQIEDLLKYSGRDDPKNLGILSGLAELFDLQNIIVADGFKNTAGRGLDAVFTRLWDPTMCMVAHIAETQDIEDPEPRIGNTIMFNDQIAAIPGAGDMENALIIEEYREEKRRGGTFRARGNYQLKILHPEAGHLLTAVTA